MAKTELVCPQCGKKFMKENASINRALKIKAPLYCGKKCSGFARRSTKSTAQKKAEKREYDKAYRAKNKDLIKKKKAAYFQKTYDPERARKERKKRSAQHTEYCRRPAYKKWKKEYDRNRRAKIKYGCFWECFLLTQDLRQECLERQTDYEIRLAKDTLNKAQRRKKDVETFISYKP